MKIIKKGRKQKGWSKEFTCTGDGNGGGGCGAILLVSKSDLYETKNCDYTGDCDYYTTYSCPCCDVETDIDVPCAVKSGLPSKTTFMRNKK